MLKGHRVIIVTGNHDLELHFPKVQQEIVRTLNLPPELAENLRFNEWFYISNGDTLVEHGNQYDPYCMAQNPINPFIQKYNKLEVRLPFGNLATRYMINGMGFFNPHLDSNYIMSLKEYVVFFFKYIFKAQPTLILIWLWGATVTLVQSFLDRLKPPVKEPLAIEDHIEWIAKKANASPRMVRELNELSVPPAASYPLLIARELWLDRAFIVLLAALVMFQLFFIINNLFAVSFFWVFIPFFLCLPFFIFYSRSITSDVHSFKEPQERILSMSGIITKVNRVIYGHTHIPRHENIGAIEHLNSGTWSPAFEDVECTRPIEQRTFIWIAVGGPKNSRVAELKQFFNGRERSFVKA